MSKITSVPCTPEKLADLILKWESRAGESFADYYMHDNVKDVSWAFWLLGKGFTERANELIDEIQGGNKCIDQELLYDLYGSEDDFGGWVYESHKRNVLLWAEFLCASNRYFKDIEHWFLNYGE